MNVQQEGLGVCGRCGTPIMQAINQPGIKGVCFGCKADGEDKHGRTVRVTKEVGEGLTGRVDIEEVEHEVNPSSPIIKDVDAARKAIAAKAEAKGAVPMPTPVEQPAVNDGTITIKLTIDELMQNGIVTVLLQSAYDAIDDMPPCKTLRETKRMIKVQEDIEAILKQQSPYKGEA